MNAADHDFEIKDLRAYEEDLVELYKKPKATLQHLIHILYGYAISLELVVGILHTVYFHLL